MDDFSKTIMKNTLDTSPESVDTLKATAYVEHTYNTLKDNNELLKSITESSIDDKSKDEIFGLLFDRALNTKY